MHTLNAVKLRNQLRGIKSTLHVNLHNVRINGVLQGCSGFVTDPDSGRIVYVSTDRNHGTNSRGLFRIAATEYDYVGGHNNYATYDLLAESVVDLLQPPATPTDLDDEEDSMWEAAIERGFLKVIQVGR